MLNRKVKMVVAALLSCVMLMALAGCGNKTENKLAGDIPTLKYYVPTGKTTEQFETILDELNPYLEEKIGCHVEIVSFDSAAWEKKYPLVLSSGEEVDLMFTASWSGYYTQIGQKSFIPLDDLLDKYGLGIKENIQAECLEAAKVNGKIYGIPANKDSAQGYAMYMDKKILDEAGVKAEDIKTINDIEPVLAYIKNNKPGMNGLVSTLESGGVWLATDEALKEGYMDNSKIESGFDSWGGLIAFDKEKEEFFLLSPENSNVFTSAAKLMSDWYNKGYFKDGIIAGNDVPATLWREGKFWMLVTSDTPGNIEKFEKQMNTDVEMVVFRDKIKSTSSMTGSLTAIPHSSKNPELAMKFLNLMYTDEKVINLITYGKEGVQYEKVADNMVKRIDEKWSFADGWKAGNTFKQYITDEKTPDYLEKLEEYNNTAKRSDIIGFAFDSSTVKNEVAAVSGVYEKYKRIFWVGAGNIDKSMTEFFEQLEKVGINKIVDEYNRQFKEWKKTK